TTGKGAGRNLGNLQTQVEIVLPSGSEDTALLLFSRIVHAPKLQPAGQGWNICFHQILVASPNIDRMRCAWGSTGRTRAGTFILFGLQRPRGKANAFVFWRRPIKQVSRWARDTSTAIRSCTIVRYFISAITIR